MILTSVKYCWFWLILSRYFYNSGRIHG